MRLDEYQQYDAVGLAGLVQHGELHPAELAAAALQAITTIDPDLNAVIETYPERATRKHTDALPDGPLRGVPFLVKDLGNFEEGKRCDMGSRLGDGFVPDHPTTLMERFQQAGLNSLGRTTTPEFGLNAATESVFTGPTRSPWDSERGVGGSSGGAAAAVASGMVPLAHASDGGGSIRIPASCCGIFGLKPTRGRTPAGPDVAYPIGGLGHNFAVSRSVRDSAALLDAVAGSAPGDPFQIGRPARPYLDEVQRQPEPLRIAYTARPWSADAINPEAVSALEDTAKLCADLGHSVSERMPSFDYDGYMQALTVIWCASLTFRLDAVAAATGRTISPDTVEAATLACYQRGTTLRASEYLTAQSLFNRVSRACGQFFQSVDVLLTPTTAGPAPPIGTLDQNAPGIDADGWFARIFGYAPFTALFNVTGQPAMSVPLAQSADGLPIGMQFVARYGDEATLFRLAAQLEEARPWSARQPHLPTT